MFLTYLIIPILFFSAVYGEELSLEQQYKDRLKECVAQFKSNHNGIDLAPLKQNQCSLTAPIKEDPHSPLYVFVSFSMPDEALLSLSQDVQKVGGIFVLRGLPENSFKKLAIKLYSLRKQGLHATIQIDPRLFTQFNVEKVPSFVVKHPKGFDKLSGHVSLRYALEKISSEASNQLKALL